MLAIPPWLSVCAFMTEGVGVLGYGTAINFLQVKFCYLESKNNNFECFYEAQDNKKKNLCECICWCQL